MTISANTFRDLLNITGRNYCSNAKEDLVCYGYDATAINFLPEAIIFPEKTSQVASILRLADRDHFNVIPRGSGSGMTGGSLPINGGVVVIMTRFNRIHKIDTDNLFAHVEPGVITGHFHRAVEKKGLFYPPDPASSEFCTLGGNMAECAGGPRALKYGVTRDYVLGLEVVLPTGEIIKTGVRTAKSVVGYDLTRLFIGSEGTLGIITRMTLRLLPLPKKIRTMTAIFGVIDKAAETVSEIIRRSIIPRTIEFMDHTSLQCVKDHFKIGLPAKAQAMLLIDVDGDVDEADRAITKLKELCLSQGAKMVELAKNNIEAANLWKARKAISPALFKYGPDKINEDIVVPRSKIPEMVKKIDILRKETGLIMASFGHAGDGNIHFNIMLDKKDKTQLKKAEAAVEELFDHTLKLGGTISGEHGIGITKAPYMGKEIGFVEIDLMKKIKKVFDPKGILNPGKIFPS